ncbi:unnamed protein product [Acanthoscelides obtectus]|uniref:ceramide glucosyltransferase n=1 Tax=Acanthoscelides obtectus TaxID=200917 RepID=A0A9P0LZ76_ACAOB|nr:unnamed protein product [Acanthoscelides obtectus]CAK1628412.1 Ceramide glucosyltransferase 2 [Acanthoscelides obtectus]
MLRVSKTKTGYLQLGKTFTNVTKPFHFSKYRLHKKVKPLPSDEPYPGVSILKPLMGEDPHLVSNLETFFTMTYPEYELLFCIEDEKDPAIDVVNALKEKYPKLKQISILGVPQ